MTHGSGTRYRAVPMRSELCVVVGCHTFVSAIPTRFVSRLVLNEDVEVAKQKELVYSSGETFVNANLGTLLGLPPLGLDPIQIIVDERVHQRIGRVRSDELEPPRQRQN